MKLAEALMLRADVQKKLASLRQRIGNNAVFQEGDEPHEGVADLIKQSFQALDELENLVFRINETNLATTLKDGRTLTAAIAHRDTLVSRHALLQHAIASCSKEPDRYSAREIKWVTQLKIPDLQKQSADLAKKIRELNGSVQEINWQTEITV